MWLGHEEEVTFSDDSAEIAAFQAVNDPTRLPEVVGCHAWLPSHGSCSCVASTPESGCEEGDVITMRVSCETCATRAYVESR